MNAKIPLKVVAERLSAQSDVTPDDAQTFLKELFNVVTEELLTGQSVEIDGLGTFSVRPGLTDPVKFIPSDDFSADVNAPFAIFSPIEVDETISDSDLSLQEEPQVETVETIESDIYDSNNVYPDESDSKELKPDSETATDDVQSLQNVTDETAMTTDEPENSFDSPVTDGNEEDETDNEAIESESESIDEQQDSYIPEDEEEYVEYYDRPKSRFGIGFLVGLLTGLIIGALALAAYALFFVGNFTL